MAIPAFQDDTILEAVRRLELLSGGGGVPVPISTDPGTAVVGAGTGGAGDGTTVTLTVAPAKRLLLGGVVASYNDRTKSQLLTVQIGAAFFKFGIVHGSLVLPGADLPCAAGEDVTVTLAGLSDGATLPYVLVWGRVIDA